MTHHPTIPPLAVLSGLPAMRAVPDLRDALREKRSAVFQAPPGSGKTTAVPLMLLDEPWLGNKKIVMLEPRRLAARLAARRMAFALGERVGETVGLRTRQETKVSNATRIEVATEGVLTRMLQTDPALSEVGLIVFDEFHQRSLHADLGLALALDAREGWRDDLRLLIMSATINAGAVAHLIGDAPVVAVEGHACRVETKYLPRPAGTRIEQAAAAAVRLALEEEEGSILVFLAGEGEIRRVQAALREPPLAVPVLPLYGALPLEAQDAAVRPAPPGTRKVVLATSIAETSLTIEGIRVVIDGGQSRRSSFDPRSGLSRLLTGRVSAAEADQRRGRAGRTEPGVCYRLWSEAETRTLAAFPLPEILETDLAPLALDLAVWGAAPDALSWLDPPPPASWKNALSLLADLGALDADGRVTPHGRRMAALPLHPRLSHMILAALERGWGATACDVAALLSERDPLRETRETDLRLRLDAVERDRNSAAVNRDVLARIRKNAADWRRQVKCPAGRPLIDAGPVLALAYPDRLGKRRGPGVYLLSNGRGAQLPEHDALSTADFLVVADLDLGAGGNARNARIFLAAPLEQADIEDLYRERLAEDDAVRWDPESQSIQARRRVRLGALVLREATLPSPDPARLAEGLIDGIRQSGLSVLPWSKNSMQFRDRVRFMRRLSGPPWPDMSEETLLADLDLWLAPCLAGMSRLSHLKSAPLLEALKAMLPRDLLFRLDADAPTHYETPAGTRVALTYDDGATPILAVRLQDMFGLDAHPSLAGGKAPLVLHLLSPAQRPIQITQDLPGFWRGSYAAVKAEMKGRYPKHVWPDDPLTAPPGRRPKPRSG